MPNYFCGLVSVDLMKTVLIPTDFSKNSWNAVEYAVSLFKDIPCNFYVLHVGRIDQSGVEGNSFTMPTERLDAPVKEKLSELFKRIASITTNVQHNFIALQEYGNLVNSIRNTVAEKKVDLIVMGTKGASGVQQAVVGSNTGDVITKVHCNLLVIPEKANPIRPKEIAFPTDFNILYSHLILESISEMLHISGANLRVINVSKPTGRLNRTQKQHKHYLEDYLEELFSDSHSFQTITDEKVKNAIEGFAARGNIDMVIMVAKNLNYLQQLLFDSTIEKLSFHTTVPLLVLH